MSGQLFPKWTNKTPPLIAAGLVVLLVYVGFLVYYGGSPYTQQVGYQPVQPMPFSHALHAGELGLDCRYCHNTVEVGDRAAVPPTQTCLNCHNDTSNIWPRRLDEDDPASGWEDEYDSLAPLREAAEAGRPIEWVRVHDLPDFAYFNHASHVAAGVGCDTCHGRVDHMDIVYQAEPMSMAWCLECHREPERHLRPPEEVTNMHYEVELREMVELYRLERFDEIRDPDVREILADMEAEGVALTAENLQYQRGLNLKRARNIQDATFMTDCSTCHR